MSDSNATGRTKRFVERASAAAEKGRLWVEARDPATSTGVAVGWFRRYAAADGQLYAVLLTAYVFLTLLPAALVMSSYLDTDPNALDRRHPPAGHSTARPRRCSGACCRAQRATSWARR